MTEIAIRTEANLTEKIEWSRAMAPASLLPKQYRDNPGNILYAVEYADALGIERINAITSIHVIEGKPSASADLIAGLIRRAGHKLRVVGDDTYAEAHLIRADDPEFTYVARWDLDKARQAGLLGKGTWKNYPAALLRSRAITEVGRMGASDALLGVVYTPEELGAEVDNQGAPVKAAPFTQQQAQPASGASRMADILGTERVTPQERDAALDDIEQAVQGYPGDSPYLNPSSALGKRMFATFGEAGITDKDDRLAYVSTVIGREVTTSKDMTDADAEQVIAKLREVIDSDAADIHDAEVVEDDPTLAPGWGEQA